MYRLRLGYTVKTRKLTKRFKSFLTFDYEQESPEISSESLQIGITSTNLLPRILLSVMKTPYREKRTPVPCFCKTVDFIQALRGFSFLRVPVTYLYASRQGWATFGHILTYITVVLLHIENLERD